MARRSKGLAMLLVVAIVLAGCGGDDDGGKDSADAPRRTTSTTEAPTTTTEPVPPTAQPARVQVTFADDSCDVPAELTAGPTRFAATNTSQTARGLTLVALDDGQTVADLLARLAEDAADVVTTSRFGAGPNGLPPGGSGAVQLDLQAGSYVALCQVPASRELPAAGLIRPLTVKAPATEVEGSALPSGPTIALTDKAIEVPEGFSGKGLFRVENTGEFPHEILIYHVAEDTTFDEAVAWLTAETPPKGPAKASLAGGVSALSPEQEAAVDLDLAGGIYIFASFLSGADGKGDETNGLIEQVNLP